MKFKEIVFPESVIKQVKKFPKNIREKFYWCLQTLQENPRHPSLRNKPIQGSKTDWEFSINMNYRCIYRIENESILLKHAGKHEDVF